MSRTVVLYLLASIFNSLPIFSEGNPLQNVLDVIVAEHPESKSLAGLSKSHKSHFESSGILPDPKIGFAYRNYPTRNGYSIGGNNALDTPTMTGIEFSVSQEFPFPGKLGTEKRIAKTIETEANLSYTLGVNRLVSDLLLRVNKFQRTEKKRLLNLKIIDLLNSQKVISEGYYSSGSIPLTGTIKVSVAKTSAMEKETEYITLLGDLSNQLEYYNVSNKINIQDLKGMD
ncbi:TolC family protein, partial [Leptospira sp. id769339]